MSFKSCCPSASSLSVDPDVSANNEILLPRPAARDVDCGLNRRTIALFSFNLYEPPMTKREFRHLIRQPRSVIVDDQPAVAEFADDE